MKENSLNLLSSSRNDLVSCTAIASSGCYMLLVTTGRGTPFGTIVPTVKIFSNTALFKNNPHWIDFNAGGFLKKIVSYFLFLLDYLITVASGKPVNNENNGFKEVAILKSRVTL